MWLLWWLGTSRLCYRDIPLTVYESKAGKPYMNIKDWAKTKWVEQNERDKQLGSIYMSAKMMKYHPLMTKELRKTYGLMASAALRAMSAEFKYGVKKEFNKMSTALKAMRQKMKAEKALYGPINKRGFFGKIDFWNRLIALSIMILLSLLCLLALTPKLL